MSSTLWSDHQIEETAQELIAKHGDKALQRLIDMTQDEIRTSGNATMPHDAIVARINACLAQGAQDHR